MGLDMYLNGEMYVSKTDYTKYRETMDADKSVNDYYQIVTTLFDLDKYITKEAFAGLTISFPVAYWRKSNQIHKWFVDNIQDGQDDCQKYIVYSDRIEQLRDICMEVLADNSKAEDLLPNGEGFFFGSQEYDEYYFGDLQITVEMLNKVLELPEMYDLYYQSSW